MFELQRRL